MKKKLVSSVPLLVVAALLLSACAKAAMPTSLPGEARDMAYEESAAEAPMVEFVGEMDAGGGDFSTGNVGIAAVAAERLVIKTASLSIVVENPKTSMDEIAALADRLGGFVVSSNLYKNTLYTGLEVPGAYITIRVPSESFQQTLDAIRNDAIEVLTDNQSGQDVTGEYTDLQSRLRNLEGAEEMLRQIMEEADDTEDVLTAFNQLNYITEQIEVLKGQIKYYEESAALSAITIDLVAKESAEPIKIGPWEPAGVAKEAIQALLKALQNIAEAVIWFALYLLPILLIIAIPVWLVFRWLRNRPAKATTSTRRKK
jgi:hypothetical protein